MLGQLSTIRVKWQTSLRFRLTLGLSLLIILIMGTTSFWLITERGQSLYHDTKTRSLNFSRAFAIMGATVVMDNLFRIQEAMPRFVNDPNCLHIDVIDLEHMIVASKHPERIGIELHNDQSWLELTRSGQETVMTVEDIQLGSLLVIVEPILDGEHVTAWSRVIISLAGLEQIQKEMTWRLVLITILLMILAIGALWWAMEIVSRHMHDISARLQHVLETLRGTDQTTHPHSETLPPSEPENVLHQGEIEKITNVTHRAMDLLFTQSEHVKALTVLLEKRVEVRTNQLLASQELYRSVVDTAAEGILTFDGQGKIDTWNQAANRMFGFSYEEVHGKMVDFLTPGSFWLPPHLTSNTSQLHPGEHNIGIRRFMIGRRKDGSTFPLDLAVSEIWVKGHQTYTGLIRDITVQKKNEDALQEANFRLKVLSRQILELQETERQQLAYDLHDEIGQNLTAMKMNLQTLRGISPATKGLGIISDSEDILDQMLTHVRELSLDLHPSLLDDLGLGPTVRWYATRQADRAGWVLKLHLDQTSPQLTKTNALSGFRFVQEALTNIMKHAQAKEVEVHLVQDSEELKVVIQDDGIGFDVSHALSQASKGKTFGLLSMQERIRLVGGHVTIQSTQGKGTAIRARIPVK